MKPPRLPGTEKFRFCDKKFEQMNKPNGILIEHNDFVGNDDHHKATDKVDADFLFNLTNSHLSVDSLSCHSCLSTDGVQYSTDNNSTSHLMKISDQKSYDSVSTASSTLDDIISQMNLNGYTGQQHYARSKRKPSLPISSRMTSRLFNLTTFGGGRHFSDEDDVDLDGEEENEILCTANVKELAYSSSTVANASDSSMILSTLNRSQQQKLQQVDGRTMSRSLTPVSQVSSDTSESISKHLHQTSPEHHLCEPRHRHNLHRPLIMPAPSHASLMSDESSSSISLSTTNREEFDDSLRSSSCSPVVDHWAKNCSINNTVVHVRKRLSTLSNSSWDEEDEELINHAQFKHNSGPHTNLISTTVMANGQSMHS